MDPGLERLKIDKANCLEDIKQINEHMKLIEDNGSLYLFRQATQKRLGLMGGLINRLGDALLRLVLTVGIIFIFNHLIELGLAYRDAFVIPYIGLSLGVIGFSILMVKDKSIMSRADHRLGPYDVWGFTQLYDVFFRYVLDYTE